MPINNRTLKKQIGGNDHFMKQRPDGRNEITELPSIERKRKKPIKKVNKTGEINYIFERAKNIKENKTKIEYIIQQKYKQKGELIIKICDKIIEKNIPSNANINDLVGEGEDILNVTGADQAITNLPEYLIYSKDEHNEDARIESLHLMNEILSKMSKYTVEELNLKECIQKCISMDKEIKITNAVEGEIDMNDNLNDLLRQRKITIDGGEQVLEEYGQYLQLYRMNMLIDQSIILPNHESNEILDFKRKLNNYKNVEDFKENSAMKNFNAPNDTKLSEVISIIKNNYENFEVLIKKVKYINDLIRYCKDKNDPKFNFTEVNESITQFISYIESFKLGKISLELSYDNYTIHTTILEGIVDEIKSRDEMIERKLNIVEGTLLKNLNEIFQEAGNIVELLETISAQGIGISDPHKYFALLRLLSENGYIRMKDHLKQDQENKQNRIKSLKLLFEKINSSEREIFKSFIFKSYDILEKCSKDCEDINNIIMEQLQDINYQNIKSYFTCLNELFKNYNDILKNDIFKHDDEMNSFQDFMEVDTQIKQKINMLAQREGIKLLRKKYPNENIYDILGILSDQSLPANADSRERRIYVSFNKGESQLLLKIDPSENRPEGESTSLNRDMVNITDWIPKLDDLKGIIKYGPKSGIGGGFGYTRDGNSVWQDIPIDRIKVEYPIKLNIDSMGDFEKHMRCYGPDTRKMLYNDILKESFNNFDIFIKDFYRLFHIIDIKCQKYKRLEDNILKNINEAFREKMESFKSLDSDPIKSLSASISRITSPDSLNGILYEKSESYSEKFNQLVGVIGEKWNNFIRYKKSSNQEMWNYLNELIKTYKNIAELNDAGYLEKLKEYNEKLKIHHEKKAIQCIDGNQWSLDWSELDDSIIKYAKGVDVVMKDRLIIDKLIDLSKSPVEIHINSNGEVNVDNEEKHNLYRITDDSLLSDISGDRIKVSDELRIVLILYKALELYHDIHVRYLEIRKSNGYTIIPDISKIFNSIKEEINEFMEENIEIIIKKWEEYATIKITEFINEGYTNEKDENGDILNIISFVAESDDIIAREKGGIDKKLLIKNIIDLYYLTEYLWDERALIRSISKQEHGETTSSVSVPVSCGTLVTKLDELKGKLITSLEDKKNNVKLFNSLANYNTMNGSIIKMREESLALKEKIISKVKQINEIPSIEMSIDGLLTSMNELNTEGDHTLKDITNRLRTCKGTIQGLCDKAKSVGGVEGNTCNNIFNVYYTNIVRIHGQEVSGNIEENYNTVSESIGELQRLMHNIQNTSLIFEGFVKYKTSIINLPNALKSGDDVIQLSNEEYIENIIEYWMLNINHVNNLKNSLKKDISEISEIDKIYLNEVFIKINDYLDEKFKDIEEICKNKNEDEDLELKDKIKTELTYVKQIIDLGSTLDDKVDFNMENTETFGKFYDLNEKLWGEYGDINGKK